MTPTPAMLSDEEIAEINRRCLLGERPTLRTAGRLADHALAASAALAEREIMQPDASGSFVGDIWFGDPVRRTRGTHRWDGAKWTELPSEEEVLMGLLAEARQRAETAEATLARQAAEIAELEGLLSELVAMVRGECPSILDEDSGGSARLSMDIDAALGNAEAGE
jgi:hypothetical protein